MDCSQKIFGDLDEFLLRILTPKHSIYILEHPDRNRIEDEFEPIRILKKDNLSTIMKVKERYKKKNFTDDNGLAESCVIIRKHNDLNCIKTMEEWFDEIKKYSHRDQLSFNYVLWKIGGKIKYISKSFCLQYIYCDYIHIKKAEFE